MKLLNTNTIEIKKSKFVAYLYDIDEISDIFPIYVKTGRYNGGVYVIDGFYFDRMYMNDSEIALLKKINAERVKLSLSFEETETLNKIIMSYQKPVV